MTREEIIIGAGVIAGLAALFFYRNGGDSSGYSTDNGLPEIPALVAPVFTGGLIQHDSTSNFASDCSGSTDAQGNWYGVNLAGKCTPEASGGSTGEW